MKTMKITILVMLFTFISRFLGFLRETFIAAKFGASIESDAFFIAWAIPGTIYAAFAAAIGTTFIPVYSKRIQNSRWNYPNNLMNFMLIVSLILLVFSILFAPTLVKLFAPGFTMEGIKLAVDLTRIMLPIIIFLTLSAIYTGMLQMHNSFLIPASVGIPFNLFIVIYLLFFGDSLGIYGLSVVVTIAVASQAIFQIPALIKRGWKYEFTLNLKDEGLVETLRLLLPVILGVVVQQINVIVDKMIASTLQEGSISALNYADRLNKLTFSIVVAAIVAVLYPKISKLVANKNMNELRIIVVTSIKSLLIILIPITFFVITLSEPLVQLLFQRGEFDYNATLMTTSAFIFYSVGLLWLGLRELFNRIYYSFDDTKTPMINAAITVVLNIILNLILVRFMDVGGLALASSISLLLSCILLFRGLKYKFKEPIITKSLLATIVKIVISVILSTFIVNILYSYSTKMLDFSFSDVVAISISLLTGFLTYIVLLILFKEKLMFELKKNISNSIRNRSGLY